MKRLLSVTKMISKIVVICIFITSNWAFNLTSDSGRCYKDEPNLNTCLLQAFNNLKPQIQHGDSRFGIPSLDPLFIDDINITHTSEEANFHCRVKDFMIYEVHNYEVTNLVYTEEKITIDIKFEKIHIVAHYTLSGSVLNVPFKGEGKVAETYSPIIGRIVVSKNNVFKNNVEHCNILSVKFQLDLKLVEADFEGLKGEGITESPNSFLIHHANEMSHVLSRIYEGVFEKLWTEYLKNMCDYVPYSDLLPMRP